MSGSETNSTRIMSVGVAVVFAACSGTSSSANFSVAATTFDTLLIRWSPPAGGADSYDLDGRLGDEEWRAIQHGIPGNAIGVSLTLDPATPELVTIGLRLRAVRASEYGAWEETSWFRGVRPPVMIGATVAVASDDYTHTGPITVTWQNRSEVANEVELERGPLTTSAEYQTLPVVFGATSYTDDDAAEGTLYQYRLRYGVAGTWSDWAVQVTSEPIDLLQPKSLTVTPAPGGVLVSWTPRSTRSNYQSLLRWTAWTTDSLPQIAPTASEYLDPLAEYWPTLRYQVVTVRTDYFASTIYSEVSTIQPFTIAGPPVLRASSVSLMAGESFARDGQGRFHVGSQGYSGPYVSRATATGYEEHVLAGFVYNQGPPRLGIDGEDHLHAIYGRTGAASTDPSIVTHEWHDGSAWQREDVPISTPSGGTAAMVSADVAKTGAVHVVLPDPNGGSMQHAFKEDGTWGTASIPASGFNLQLGFQFGVAPDGTAYAISIGAVPYANECRLRIRPPGGSWGTEEPIPGCARADEVWLVPANAGKAAVVYGLDGPDIISADLYLARREETGGFSPPELIMNRPFNGHTLDVWSASDADGTRIAIAVDVSPDAATSAKTQLAVRDPAGNWMEVTPGPGTARSWLLGFDAGGKVWALGNFSWLDLKPVPYAVFEEQ